MKQYFLAFLIVASSVSLSGAVAEDAERLTFRECLGLLPAELVDEVADCITNSPHQDARLGHCSLLTFSPQGSHLVSVHESGRLRLWDANDGILIREYENIDSASYASKVSFGSNLCAFTDENHFFILADGNKLLFFNVENEDVEVQELPELTQGSIRGVLCSYLDDANAVLIVQQTHQRNFQIKLLELDTYAVSEILMPTTCEIKRLEGHSLLCSYRNPENTADVVLMHFNTDKKRFEEILRHTVANQTQANRVEILSSSCCATLQSQGNESFIIGAGEQPIRLQASPMSFPVPTSHQYDNTLYYVDSDGVLQSINLTTGEQEAVFACDFNKEIHPQFHVCVFHPQRPAMVYQNSQGILRIVDLETRRPYRISLQVPAEARLFCAVTDEVPLVELQKGRMKLFQQMR